MEELVREHPAKNAVVDANEQNSHALLIISLPESRVLRVASRSLFLAMLILALPSISSLFGDFTNAIALYEPKDSGVTTLDDHLFRDLLDEGLIKKGQKGFFQGAANDDEFEFLKDAGIDLIIGAHLEQQMFDFVFTSTSQGIQQFDGVVKDGGLVISPLSNDPLTELHFLKNHKIAYLRRFKNTMVVAMRKSEATISKSSCGNPSSKQVLFDCVPREEKKAALKGLEDAFLEPPRRSALGRKSSHTGRKIKFLPDLLMDSLDEYPRRVFISDESQALDWFNKNYPMRDQEFEVYDLDVVTNNGDDTLASPAVPQETGVSTWLTKNVKHEDYVVMKAEAQVVLEMIQDKTLRLVDELFLECKNQWQDGTRRAYWQCLTLYGKVKDEGIAVHQWWN